jgi:hypothetical protein
MVHGFPGAKAIPIFTHGRQNSNMLGGTYKTITDYDAFVLGLEHHWLLRSAFKKANPNTNAPPPPPALKTPRQKGSQ